MVSHLLPKHLTLFHSKAYVYYRVWPAVVAVYEKSHPFTVYTESHIGVPIDRQGLK
jgi:hypothetical protein